MESSPKPSYSNKQGKTITASPPSSIYRLPQRTIAVTHPNLYSALKKWQKVNMPQSHSQQSPKASIQSKTSNSVPSTQHIIETPTATMAQKKNELWGSSNLELPTTIGMTDLNPPTQELQEQRTQAVYDRAAAARLAVAKEKAKNRQEEEIKRLTENLNAEKETLTRLEAEVESALAKATSTATINRLEQEISVQQNQPSDEQIKLEQHRQFGKAFVKGMNTKYNFNKWQNQDTTSDKRNLGAQTAAILYVYFDIPNWFSEEELCTLLGYATRNHNVGQAILRMVDRDMHTSNFDSAGTKKFYLSEWPLKFIPRSPEDNPDIETTNPTYTNFIILRMQAGQTLMNSRKRPKTPPQATATTSVTLAAAVTGAEAQAKRKLELDPQDPKKKSKRKAANDNLNSNTANQTVEIPDSSSSDYEDEDSDSDDTPKRNNDTGFMEEDVFDPIIPAAKNKSTDFSNARFV